MRIGHDFLSGRVRNTRSGQRFLPSAYAVRSEPSQVAAAIFLRRALAVGHVRHDKLLHAVATGKGAGISKPGSLPGDLISNAVCRPLASHLKTEEELSADIIKV